MKVNSNENKIIFKLISKQNIHLGTIQGMSYNKIYDLIATHSLDKTVKIHLFKENKLKILNTFDNRIDNSRGLFKRILFTENTLFIFSKNNMVFGYSYPFREEHLMIKIGPLNSSIVKILKKENLLVICTKKSIYLFDDYKMICCVDNACFMAITDGFIYNNTIFVSSLDGFVASIRIN
ncbi:MAG: hypothetical protein KC414_14605 [Romboutsia sp.]|nr:hypothetical protein [Romboutsia sp.]